VFAMRHARTRHKPFFGLQPGFRLGIGLDARPGGGRRAILTRTATLAKFEHNERVIFTWDGAQHRGRVTAVLPQTRRVVTDQGRRLNVPVRRLRPSPDRVLILETRLDRSLRSTRLYGPMFQQWLAAYKVDALYERVHTIEALRGFLRQEGKHIATRYIHIMGHGMDKRGQGKASLRLTFEMMDLAENADIFQGLDGKIIIFSCCDIGADRCVLETVKEMSGASAVIGYRVQVEDWYTNLAEALLYERLINTSMHPRKAVELAGEILDRMGVRLEGIITRKPVLVCV